MGAHTPSTFAIHIPHPIPLLKPITITTMSYLPYPTIIPPLSASSSASSPVYVILIIGMIMFMASNIMPALLPDPAKMGQVTIVPGVLTRQELINRVDMLHR